MPQDNLVTVMLMTKEPEESDWRGQGRKSFTVLPRIGEFIELELNEKLYLYRVVAVGHPGEPTVNAGDIYAVRMGLTSSVITRLFEKTEAPATEGSAAWVGEW